MDFSYSDEQMMLRDTVRSFVEAKAPVASVRKWMETESGHDTDLWREMAGLGLPAMNIPEEYGGAGFSFGELGIVLEELGRGLTPSPMFSTVVLGAGLVMAAGSDEQKAQILDGVASGEITLAVAAVEEGGAWDPESITTTVEPHGKDLILNGTKSFVVDGHTADHLIVVAKDAGGALRHVLVPAQTEGLTATRLETMDMTRKQARVELDRVRVASTSELAASSSESFELMRDIAAVGLAYEQLGGAQMVMEMAVQYAKERYQFGRAIGSFQAVKHACADMLVAVESARSAAYGAGWAVDNDLDELKILAPLARSVCSDAFFDAAASNIQVHGGIGFTWENDAHLYFKRAKTSQLLLGGTAEWRRRLADSIGV